MPHNAEAKNEALKSGTGGGMAGIISYVGLHTLADPGTATTAGAGEATGGSPAYARLAVTWGTPASGQVSNSAALLFDVPAATYAYFTFWNAATGNTVNYRGYAPFGGAAAVRVYASVDAADVTANTITSSAHGMVNTDRVMVFNVLAETLPAGLTEGTIYFVVGATTDTFQVSLTSGGAAVDITGIGELFAQRTVPETFAAQGQVSVAIGALILAADGV